MRATKEFFKNLRLEIEQGDNAQVVEQKETIDIEALQKRIKDLEAENKRLKQAIEAQKQQSLPVIQESATDDKEVVKQCLTELIEDVVEKDSIKELLNILNHYNNNHNHEYTDVVNALYDKQKEMVKPQVKVEKLTVEGDLLGDNAVKQVNNYKYKQLQ